MATVKKQAPAKKAAKRVPAKVPRVPARASKPAAKTAAAKKAAPARKSVSAADLNKLEAAVAAVREAAATALKAAEAARSAAQAARAAARAAADGGARKPASRNAAPADDWTEGSVKISRTESGTNVRVLIPGQSEPLDLRVALQQARGVRLTAQLPLDGPTLTEAQIDSIVSFFEAIDNCESLVAWCASCGGNNN